MSIHYHISMSQVDFEDLQIQSEAQRRQIQQREEKHRALVEQRVTEVHREMAGKFDREKVAPSHITSTEQGDDIQTCLTEMESCFQLLLPRFELLPLSDSVTGDLRPMEFESSSGDGEEEEDADEQQLEDDDEVEVEEQQLEADEDECNHEGKVKEGDMPVTKTAETSSKPILEDDSDDESEEEEWEEVEGGDVLQAHGIAGHNYSLTIELPKTVKVIENEENSSIISTLMERHRLVASKFLPAVNKWIQVGESKSRSWLKIFISQWFTKAGQEESLKQAIDLKGQLTAVVMKYSDLSIVCSDSGNVKSRDDVRG